MTYLFNPRDLSGHVPYVGATANVNLGIYNLITTGDLTDGVNSLTIENAKTAYNHSQDNTQAHSDYLLNTGDTASGDYNFDSGTLFIDATNNKVGVGTITPSVGAWGSFFTVQGSSNSAGLITSQRNANNVGYGTGFQGVLDNSAGTPTQYGYFNVGIENNTAGAEKGMLSFFNRGSGVFTEKMRITNEGRVGIGITSPTAPLVVKGTGEVYNSNIYKITEFRTGDDKLKFTIAGKTADHSSYFILGNSDSKKLGLLSGTTGTGFVIDNSGDFSISTATNANIVGGSIVLTPFTIEGDTGDVGIGTINPSAKLHVSGGGATAHFTSSQAWADLHVYNSGGYGIFETHGDKINLWSGSVNTMTIDDGKVGIGITSPARDLHIYSPTTANLKLQGYADNAQFEISSGDGEGGEYSLFKFQDNSVNKWEVGKNPDDDFYIYDYVGARQVLRIKDGGDMYLMEYGGNVGIGTNSPEGILHTKKTTGVSLAIFDSYDSDSFVNVRGGTDGNAETAGIKLYQGLNEKWRIYNEVDDNFYIADLTTSDFPFRILDGGNLILQGSTGRNVGIGVNDPHSKLEVAGAISSAVATITASADNTDVSGINTLFINPAAAVVIGGFTGGVAGQHLNIVVVDADQNVTIEDQEGVGTQDIYMHQGIDETLASEIGGWYLVCDGTNWYDCSHARHV